MADPASKPWLCWINEAAALDYDLVWLENVTRLHTEPQFNKPRLGP